MIRTALAAATLLAATPALAQSTTQDELDARFDRALAAGYKALFLCSAIANAERNGAERSPESVERWELAGIQSPLDGLAPDLPFQIQRGPTGQLVQVSVSWADGVSPRIAIHDSQKGCYQLPVGGAPAPFNSVREPKTLADGEVIAPTASLGDVFGRAFGPAYGQDTRTTAALVMLGGEIVGERYVAEFGPAVPQRTWSVAKSLATTLVGAATYRGEIAVNTSAKLGLAFNDRRNAITIDHLLRMASGRYSDTPGNRTDPLYYGGSSVEETAQHWPLIHTPGTVFRYANNDTLAAVRAITPGFGNYPPAAFLETVGMDHTVAETDWRGDYILSSQVWSTARDLAKLGQLYLNDGLLADGNRILPEGWVKYVSAPSGPQPDGPFGYGAGFWLFNKSDGIPPDTFAAMGNRGQFIVIVPSMNVVIVRRGEDPAGSRFDIAGFTRDVLESLAE